MGAFGIKTPKEYGGLGLSQTTYCRAAILLGSYCGNITALLSAHQSIGIPQPLLVFGTEEQKKKFLPRVAGGEISAFALTEAGVGSDPARMSTHAEPTKDGKHYILNGTKLWCTNGTKAGLIVVMCKTPPKMVRGRERNQISAFIVDTTWPGVKVDYRCRFMGLTALYNGEMSFTDVKVPTENIIGNTGDGLRIALTTLNTGRMTLPACTTGTAKACLEIVREWTKDRVQWGAPIVKHAAIADKVAKMASTVYAMEAMTLMTAALVDKKETDIRVEAAMCKMWCTEAAWRVADETMQIRSGRGYETAASLKQRGDIPVPVERMFRDVRINMIFEGSSEIMRLFIAREALDPHLKKGAAAMNTKLPTGKRVAAGLKAAGFYATWYPKKLIPGGAQGVADMDGQIKRHADYATKTARKLARAMFHAMAKHQAGLEKQGVLLARLVEIGAEIFAISAVCSRTQYLLKQGKPRKELIPLMDFFVAEAKVRINERFAGLGKNNDKMGYKLAQVVSEGTYKWLEDGIIHPDYYNTES
jgi:alkylation response protein AidB-like acyl-CoA dehydrogenase